MDKNAIKKFAVWARRELISRVSQKAVQYGITEESFGDPNADSVNGWVLSKAEKAQRQRLIQKIKAEGYRQVMEEVAYTWFNRFIALRFMEVNGYLPSHVRVFTDDQGAFKPQILAEAIHLDLDGLDMEKVYAFKEANQTDELYKYLLIVQCNALNPILPGMFQKIEDYTEILFPDNLLREGSVIDRMARQGESDSIPESDWTDQVQIIGWLYEAYNTERNELVYDGNMAKSRITKELLPAATTIFTPDWPIRYMVENSLGRLWVDAHPNDNLKNNWKYYLSEGEQDENTAEKLAGIRKGFSSLSPENLLVLDPCQGSGHILAYMFDLLMQIYESYGYTAREAVGSILQHNLWGLDIDNRASQLAYFSIMMKARQYDRRFFSRGIQPHIYAILESNEIDLHCAEYFAGGNRTLLSEILLIIEALHDAKEYGSILKMPEVDYPSLRNRFDEIKQEAVPSIYSLQVLELLLPLVEVSFALSQKYHVVVTNPPYLGSGRFSEKLDNYVKCQYPDEKADLSIVMYRKALDDFVRPNGFVSFITTTSWMFLSSFEKTRNAVFNEAAITSLVDFGTELFDGKVGHNPIVAWITQKSKLNYQMTAIRLVDFCYSRRNEKEPEFFNQKNYFYAKHNTFSTIPGNPITYWVGEKIFWAFSNSPALRDIARARSGAKTGKNDIFIMNWWEVSYPEISFNTTSYEMCLNSNAKWYPHNKGGIFRNWYGNRELVVRFEKGGNLIREYARIHGNAFDINATDVFFHEGLTWTALTSYKNSFRYSPAGCVFDTNKGPMLFNPSHELLMYILGFMISPVAQFILKALNQSLSLQNGDVDKVPLIINQNQQHYVANLVESNVKLVKEDYDETELSFDFQRIAFDASTVCENYNILFNRKTEMLERLRAVSECINSYFIQAYGLVGEVSEQVSEKDLLACCSIPDNTKYVKQLISYAIGCMFGRYSIYRKGLIFAGGKWNYNQYESFAWEAEGKPDAIQFHSSTHFFPDQDNVIPITDDEYFHDDIANRFMEFVSVVYGSETLEENLRFIADALGGKGSPRDVIRNYFLNDFYADHLKVYQKRPIYWLFDSGKKNGFKCLIYMHRYQPDTIARIRTDYVHELQGRYRTAIADLERRMTSVSTAERVRLSKQLTKLQDQAEELHAYEEKIHHLADQMIPIDLDDGVKVNYAKFQDVLAKIK